LKKDTNASTVFEIDLSRPKDLKKTLSKYKVKNVDCYPLLWCQQEKVSQQWNIKFKQMIACKYYVIKLISRAPGSSSYDANLDMFPLHIHGFKLPIPNPAGYDPNDHELVEKEDSGDSLEVFNLQNTLDEIENLAGISESKD
jgi:hypothetical protein